METAVASNGFPVAVAAFLNFLRGMETGRCRPSGLQRSPFLNFLRGMETLPYLRVPALDENFLNFLRGMETCSRRPHFRESQELPKLP